MADEWKRFFDNHAPQYMDNVFTRNTLAEVDFLFQELALQPGMSVLDVGCGTGRHSVELARRGLRMTGIDLSTGMLDQARQAAQRAEVEVRLIQADVAEFDLRDEFDAALCLCEGGLALLGADDDPLERDLQVLRNIQRALKPGGDFLMTTLSSLRHVRVHTQQDVDQGRFDPLSMTETCVMEVDSPEGRISVKVRERGYVPTELKLLLRLAGFEVRAIWGGTAGNWGRRPIELDEYEIMVRAAKPAA